MERPNRHRMTGLYRSRNGWFLGVCGGLAEFFDWSPSGVRLLFAALALVMYFWPMLLVYIVLGMLLKRDPVERFQAR